ncbi:MAG: hypothetical protein V4529_16470 [Gemmatimonadota bacterium]
MRLSRIELMDNSAAVRLFTSRVIAIGGQIHVQDKRVTITDLDEDAGGSVWINKGAYVISPASMAFRVPVGPEAEWARRFEPDPMDGVALRAAGLTMQTHAAALHGGEHRGRVEVPRDDIDVALGTFKCAHCAEQFRSGAGMAAHVRSKHP